MSFAYKPDYEQAKKRLDAFFDCEIIDRPPVSFTFRDPAMKPFPERQYATQAERWLDIEYRAERAEYEMAHTKFLYEAMPVAYPNLGPEIFSAWCGCGYFFGPDTTWSEPAIVDWDADFGKAHMDFTHPLFVAMLKFTEAMIERGKGKFIVGITDLHPGGDHLAALRDPADLAIDLIENPEWVKKMLARSMPEYYAAYGVLYNMIRQAGMPASSWIPLVNDDTFYIPSNDFSCMISKEMFDEFFLEGLREECQFYNRCIYHLDGPGALRHLDSILGIESLDAIQWVFGAGNEGYHRWIDVYQRIQAAHKGVWLTCHVNELPMVFETLKPEGVWFAGIEGVKDEEMAARVVDRIAKWQ